MQNPSRMVFLLAVFTLALTASTQPVIAQSTLPVITITDASNVPGIVTRMHIAWAYDGPMDSHLQFLLLAWMPDSPEPVEIAKLNGSIREYTYDFKLSQLSIDHRIEAMLGDSVIAAQPFTAVVAREGGFTSFTAMDAPYDAGGVIDVGWKLRDNLKNINEIRIYRLVNGEGAWQHVGTAKPDKGEFRDSGVRDDVMYNYFLQVFGEGVIYSSQPLMNITSHPAWFDMGKINLLVIALIVLSAVMWYVLRSGRDSMYIRKIAGLQAVEEAVGRATEMGRSVLYVPGIQDLDDVQTIAGLTILGSVARMTAEYETRLDVPVSRSLVMSNAREGVKEAYLSVGRPDFYHDDIVHYVTDEQFGYVAAVDGIMVRERPAACFYLGAFFAESLILAETGNYVGAIQIAGTAMPTQLPFFVAACDYTLIGEELFAASAYLSGDKRMIASLKGQDVGKFIAMSAILIGSLLITLASFTSEGGFMWKLSDAFARLFAMNY